MNLPCLIVHGLVCGFFGKGGIYKIAVRHPAFQFAGFFQNVFQKGKAVFRKDQIRFPCVLIRISLHNGFNGGDIRLLKLRLDYFGNFGRRVGLYVIHALLQSFGEGFYHSGIFFDVALSRGKGCVRHIAGVFAEGGNHIAVTLCFQGGGVGFEFNSIRCLLLQFCEKRKTADLMGFRVYLNTFDSTLPESLLMLLIQIAVKFLPVSAESSDQVAV